MNKQKELYQPGKKLLESFVQNKQMADTLRERQRVKSIDSKLNNSQRFQSGKQYVLLARQELLNKPLQAQEDQQNLQSRPRVKRLQSTNKMINKQIISRRQRHLEKLNECENDLEIALNDEQKEFDEIQQSINGFIKENDQKMHDYFSQLTNQELNSREIDIIDEILNQVQNNKNEKDENIQGFDIQLNKQKQQYIKKVKKIINTFELNLLEISYILKPEITEIQQRLNNKLQEQVIEMNQRNQDFIQLIDNKQKQSYENIQIQQEQYTNKWRKIKHDQCINDFLQKIKLNEFVFPDQRLQIYKDLKEIHHNVFKNRLQLKLQLQNIDIAVLSQNLIEKFNQDCIKLNDYSGKQYDILTNKLINSVEQGKNDIKKYYDQFCQQIKHYNAQVEVPFDELLSEEYYPYIQQIIDNDQNILKQVLVYMEDTDYQTSEVLSNISLFYLEVAKKMDNFRKLQKEFILNYKIFIAKMEDQNDEDLENLNEELNNLKFKIKDAIHHPMLEINLQNAFNKIDDIEIKTRQNHDQNQATVLQNSDKIIALIKVQEIDFASIFKLVSYDQREQLMERYQQELENNIKSQIDQEEQEKEKQLQDQILNQKKGAKVPPKKDPKRQQQEYDIRFKELKAQYKQQEVQEFESNGVIWIQLESIESMVEELMKIDGLKNSEVPKWQEEDLLFNQAQFSKEIVTETLETLRYKLFAQMKIIQDDMLLKQKIEDDEFIQNSLTLLDTKLKLHYPKKGQVEVEIYQKRSAQITEHKDKYERHAKSIYEKNQLQSQQFNFIVDECMKSVKEYVDYQNHIEQQLPNQNQLSKLQGQLSQSKEKQFSFQEKYLELMSQLEDLAIFQPQNLIKQNSFYIKSLQDNKQYFSDEIQWYNTMILEISQEIQEQQDNKQEKYQILQQFLKETNLSALLQVETQYKIVQEELAQKEGTGKLYGRPRRLAQEKLRFEMTKCEYSQEYLLELLQQLKKKTDCKDIRDLLITYRNCLNRYANYLDALKQGVQPMIRFSRDENQNGVLITSDQQEKDKIQQEKELEKMGSISFQSDKNKKFNQFINDIENQVIQECQKIYQQQCPKLLNGNDKLPDWIRPYLQNIKKTMDEFRINCCRNLREMCQNFQEILQELNKNIFDSLYQKFDAKINKENKKSIELLTQNLQLDAETKNKNNQNLRPNLSNPACKEEYDKLCEKEKQRQQVLDEILKQFKNEYQDQEFQISNQYFKNALNFFEFLITFYDNNVIFEDFQILPGDEQIVKKNQNLQTLLKLKQSGKQIDYNSERSIVKLWPTLPLNSFQIENRKFQLQQQDSILIDDPKHKGKVLPKKDENQNHTQSNQLKSYKTIAQKTAYVNFIKTFQEFKNRFDESIKNSNKICEDNLNQEKKFQYKWAKSCKALFI